VLIDGEDITWVTLESLRAETVFVSADEPPFEGSVFENIRAGQEDLTLQQVTEAAKMTHAHNFILKLFNGYETVLDGDSDALDPGQRFRLSLARAIVRDPALLIIEEPSATMDEDTKTLLADAYDRICHERTVIFLPARMSTVRRTDQVIVLNEGKVAAVGSHSKLVTQSPVYRHWEYIRFNEFRKDA
jgi:ABC-type multidrug transport system fused ATPase/permease subunit